MITHDLEVVLVMKNESLYSGIQGTLSGIKEKKNDSMNSATA